MNKVILIGCGMQAYGAAYDLIKFANPRELILADAFPESIAKLQAFLEKHLKPQKLTALMLDAGNIEATAKAAMGCDLMLNTAPYKYALDITKAAIAAKVPWSISVAILIWYLLNSNFLMKQKQPESRLCRIAEWGRG